MFSLVGIVLSDPDVSSAYQSLIRNEVKEKLPDFPTFETAVNRVRIGEVEDHLMKNQVLLKIAFEQSLMNEEALHEAVLRCLAEQLRGPYKSTKYMEKRSRKSDPDPTAMMVPDDGNSLQFATTPTEGEEQVDGGNVQKLHHMVHHHADPTAYSHMYAQPTQPEFQLTR